ncbi:MAG: hypothetical protein PHO32_06525 [Candidatus Cloacimonetes bacterium]|nr:hypothetical protein [Candidatus Cloacimonadota bacterium]
MMIYIARTIGDSMASPWKHLVLFFVVPIVLLFLDATPGTQIMSLDAMVSVGLTSLIFVSLLRRNQVFSEAFMVSCLMIVAYGLLRFQLFKTYQADTFEQGIVLLKQQLPALMDNAMLSETLPMWKMVMPAMWIVTQGFALLIGFVLFQNALKVPNTIANMRFPSIYNFLIVAIMPLYLIEETKLLFFNALIGLCVIPFLHGFSVMWQRLAGIFANRIILSIFMIIIVLYATILIVLIGFGDMWMQKEKSLPGGTAA